MFIQKIVNDEQLLHIACFVISKIQDETQEVRKIADSIMVGYILEQFDKEGIKSFTEEDVIERYEKIMFNYTMDGLVKKGLVDVMIDDQGEVFYKITEAGRHVVNMIKEQAEEE